MSLANLIKLLACGRYPYAYVLRTATLAEAEKDGGMFEGAVGSPREDGNDSQGGGSMGLSDPTFLVKYPLLWIKPAGYYKGYWRIVPTIGILIVFIGIISQPLFVFLISGFRPLGRTLEARKFGRPRQGRALEPREFGCWVGL